MSEVYGFLGMRGTGDWTNEERPTNYRQGLLRMYPNGDMPLTAILSKGKSEKTDDPEYKWWTKKLSEQSGTVTELYTDAGMSSAASSATTASADGLLYVKVPENTARSFRTGHIARLFDETDISAGGAGKVMAVDLNGASSRITFKILNAAIAGQLDNISHIDIIGNSNAEGGLIPDGVSYDPTKYYNFTQIFRTPLSISRTQMRTKMRTGVTYAELKREALEYHGIEMENSILFGERTEKTGVNGKPERTSGGLLEFLQDNLSDHIQNFRSSTSLTWLQAGEEWLEEQLEVLFRYGRSEKLVLCGSGALLGLNRLARNNAQYNISKGESSYGIKIVNYETPFGVLMLKRHPLFCYKAHLRYHMVILEPQNIRYRYIDDTMFKPDPNMNKAGTTALDGIKEEYLTEAGYEFHFPETFMWLTGVGQDGTGS